MESPGLECVVHDSSDEDEVFVGAITEKERRIRERRMKQFGSRRTTMLLHHTSLTEVQEKSISPSLEVLEDSMGNIYAKEKVDNRKEEKEITNEEIIFKNLLPPTAQIRHISDSNDEESLLKKNLPPSAQIRSVSEDSELSSYLTSHYETAQESFLSSQVSESFQSCFDNITVRRTTEILITSTNESENEVNESGVSCVEESDISTKSEGNETTNDTLEKSDFEPLEKHQVASHDSFENKIEAQYDYLIEENEDFSTCDFSNMTDANKKEELEVQDSTKSFKTCESEQANIADETDVGMKNEGSNKSFITCNSIEAEIIIEKHEDLKFYKIDDLSESFKTNCSVTSSEDLIPMETTNSNNTSRVSDSIQSETSFGVKPLETTCQSIESEVFEKFSSGESIIPNSQGSEYSYQPKERFTTEDRQCQTSFLYLPLIVPKIVNGEQTTKDQFLQPAPPTIKKITPSHTFVLNTPRSLKSPPKIAATYKLSASDQKFRRPLFPRQTPDKMVTKQLKYNKIESPVAKYIRGTGAEAPLITNVLSNSIATNRKKKPVLLPPGSKIPRPFAIQPVIERH